MEPPPASPPPPPPHSSSSSYASFPILAIAILGILTTAILLLSYYIFVLKCCLNLNGPHRPRLLLLFLQRHRNRHRSSPPPPTTTTTPRSNGLDSSAINSIPTFRYPASAPNYKPPVAVECAVCLSEFHHPQLLRRLPNCSHAFHVDCIDTWLQTNDSCPLCRSLVQPFFLLISTGTPPPDPSSEPDDDDDEVSVIEIGAPVVCGPSSVMGGRWRKMESKGDEWIGDDTREKVQPIRRSFSMDSCNDRQLYVSVQEILRRNPGFGLSEEAEAGTGGGGGGGGSGRIRRSLFSFGRSSTRSASVLPL